MSEVRRAWRGRREPAILISQQAFIKSFGINEFPHKSVNLSFIIADIKDILTKDKLAIFCVVDDAFVPVEVEDVAVCVCVCVCVCECVRVCV